METIKIKTSQLVDIDYPVAGLGERVAARMIDLVFIGLLFLIFIVIFSMTSMMSSSFSKITFICVGIFALLYNLLFEIFLDGQSVGKWLMHIKVISLNGAQPSIGQYFIRWVFRLVDFALTSQLAGLIAVACTKNKQRIGDIVAGTTVVLTKQKTQIDQIAFHPVAEDYEPIFSQVNQLRDRDVELIHEVISTYYKIGNENLIYSMANKVTALLSISSNDIPKDMNELSFLQTVIKDYNYITSNA